MKNKLIVLLLVLSFYLFSVMNAWANSPHTTETFLNELKVKILENYQVPIENVVITWLDDELEKKLESVYKFYPDSKVELKLKDMILKTISGRNSLPIDLYVDGDFNRIIFLRCKIDILKEVLVASQNIKRGDLISETNVNFSKVPINKIVSNSDQLELTDIIGKEAIIDMPKGMVISSQLLRQKIVVFRGNQVTIIVKNGGLRLSSAGQVLQDGYKGQQIRVKVLGFGEQKTVLATVVNSNLVEIDLGSNTQ